MHIFHVFAALVALIGSLSPALADSTAACIRTCEAPAITCSDTSRSQKYACIRGVRDGCKVPYAKLVACVSDANKVCVDQYNPAVAACDSTFKECHKACMGGAATTRGYWCRTEVDLTGDVTRKTGYCDLEQSEAGLAACLKQFEVPDAVAGSMVLMECQPL